MTNLLVNGSFEASPIATHSFGAFTSVSGWTALSGGTIELWNALENVQATDGVNFGELDYLTAHDGFFQNVQTVAGQSYTLSFDARLRPGFTATTCTIQVLWNDQLVATVAPGATWAAHTLSVSGTGGQDKLTIREVQSQGFDGDGALYDNFSLVAANPGGLQPPAAVDDTATTNEDVAATVAPLANDSDPNAGTTLSIVAIAGQAVAANGTVDVGPAVVRLNANGTLTVTPDANLNGPIGFDYTLSNGTLTDVGRVTLNVTPVADAPIVAAAIPDQTATANQAFSYVVPASTFSDPDGNALTYSARLAAGGGSLPSWLVFNPTTRTFSGTPGTANVGQLSVEVVASDGALSATDTFTLTVGSSSPPPGGTNLLVNGSFEASPIATHSFGAFTSVQGWTALSGARIELWNALENVQATNGVNFGELDYLSAHDGFFQNVQTVAGQSYTLSFDARLRPGYTAATCTIEVLWNSTVVATVAPGSAWAVQTVNVSGTGGSDRLTIREVQSQGFDGDGALYDNFRLVAANPGGLQPPVAVDDTASTNEDVAATVAPLTNDSDPNAGTTLSIVAIAGQAVAANGSVDIGPASVRLNPNGTLTVTPDANINGPIAFDYTLSNGTLTDVGRVALNVTPVADAPIVAAAIPDQTATANQAFSYAVPANTFTDADGDALSYSARLAGGGLLPAWLAFNPTTRAFSGTPGSANVGALSVEVTANDGALSATDTFTLTVGSSSPPPGGTNLLVNGSFEASPIATHSFGAFTSVQGWTALSGARIELWNALENVQATNGVNFGELDYLSAHDGFFQNVQTVAGESYALSFDARLRPGFSAATCTIEVLWNDQLVGTVAPGGAWATHTLNVSGTGGQDKLTIREVQSQGFDGDGALYDNFRLIGSAPPGGSSLSFANVTDRAKVVDLGASFWANAARVLPLGDSNTHGWTSGSQTLWEGYRLDLWQRVVQSGLWIDYVGASIHGPPTLPDQNHQGVSGITSTEVAGQATQIATAQRPDAVLLMLGTNDALRESDAAITVPNELLTIMQRIDAVQPNVTILLAALPPIDPAVANAVFGGFLPNADAIRDAINAQLPNVVSQAQAAGINAIFVPVPSHSTADLSDGVHLTDGGHAELAAAWYSALSTNLSTNAGTFGGTRTAISGVVNVDGSELGDALRGNAAANRLDGRAGADWIEGAGGNDILTGGGDRDSFVFTAPNQGLDTVTDFTRGQDVVHISATGFGLVAGAAATVTTAADVATATSPGTTGAFIFDNAGANAGTVYWNANGGSGADAVALVTLSNVTALASADFYVA